MARRLLHTVLLVASRYDERGVMVFRWGIGHNGSPTVLAGLAESYNRRHRDAEIQWRLFDEHVEAAVTPAMLREWRDAAAADGAGFVLMVCGIQTTNYSRSRDIALMARAEGIDVVAGGIHLSCHGPSVDFFVSCGISVGVGEVEPVWDEIIEDCFAGTLKPLYRVRPEQGIRVKTNISDMTAPDLTDQPFPVYPVGYLGKFMLSRQASIDGSRGCPFICTFCSVKNAFGRTVRARAPEALAAWMAERHDRDGIRMFAFSDDDFPRSPRYVALLEAIAEVRATRPTLLISMLADVDCTAFAEQDSARGEKTRAFLELCKRAGVAKVCLGLESTSDAGLADFQKHVNRARQAQVDEKARATLERYRAAIQAWQSIDTTVECSIILGTDSDDRQAGLRTARDVMEIGADIVTFNILTPFPGSEDYAAAVASGRLSELEDFNEYFFRPVLRHPRLSPDELIALHDEAIGYYYSWRNISRRVARGLLGIGRPRVRRPMVFLSRQLGAKLILSFGLWSYFQGGLWRSRKDALPRQVRTDAEARRFYLGDAAEMFRGTVPESMLDQGRIDSLPVLLHHYAGSAGGSSASGAERR
jgi:radical SAM superfamily enzyme YgiQ (UPF0313 family)